ncbi:MAG: hypothetical protein NVS2B5_25060 [Beijerinckiaceae bacterium]
MSDASSSVKDQVADIGGKAGDIARSYSESISGFADDAQQALRERSQRLAEGARSSAQSGLSFVLEDQPLIIAAIGVAAGAALGAILPGTTAENRMMGGTRDKVAELASETAKQKLGELGSAASEATERLKNAADRAGLNSEDLTKVAKEVAEPFTNLASSGATAGQGGSPSGQQSPSHNSNPSGGSSSGGGPRTGKIS